MRSAVSIAFAGIRRSILLLARKAAPLPNRAQLLISPKFPIVLILGFLPVVEQSRVPRLGRSLALPTEPRPTVRFSTTPEENSRSEKQKSVAIGKSNISLADCLGDDGNGREIFIA
jgi:hypothetical protein